MKIEIKFDSYVHYKSKKFIYDITEYTEWHEYTNPTEEVLLLKCSNFHVADNVLFVEEPCKNKQTSYLLVCAFPLDKIKWIRFPKCKTYMERIFEIK